MRHMIPGVLCAVLLAGCSVSGGGTTTKGTSESLVTVTSMTAAGTSNSVVQSDVSGATPDLVDVQFQNQTKSASITDPSPFFGVTLTRYRVIYSRSDGGPVPAPFEAAMSLFVPPPSTTTSTGTGGSTTTALGTASATIAIVSVAAKGVSPLQELESGKSVSASATITFEGQDGLGRGVSATGGIAVIFRRP